MRILPFLCFLFLLSYGPAYPQSSVTGGLKFHGSEQAINQRTSYSIFGENQVEFSERFSLDFNLSLYPETEIGYLLRIKNKGNGRIFNLFYDGQGGDLVFKFNEEGKSNLIEAVMNRNALLNKQWFGMAISFDLIANSITLTIDDKKFTAENQDLADHYQPVILFGKSDHIIDVPSFAIRNLSVSGRETYSFPLLENEGSVVHDAEGELVGEVSNPDWLKNYAYHWKHRASFHSQAIAGANYDPRQHTIFYYNRDSIWRYQVRTNLNDITVFNQKSPVELILGTNFIDTLQNRLYTYEVYYDEPYTGPTIASLDLQTLEWRVESYQQLPTQLHHHGSFVDQKNGLYRIFGGFGNMKFSKTFFDYDITENQWITRESFSGDKITPRYFSSLGYLPESNKLYILGGMGNESGEQSLGRQYYYDLYQVDLTTKSVTKLWEIPWENDNMVPVRGMIVNDSSLYTLCYPEHFSDSFLRLYRFSLLDGSFEILGDSIPIRSDKITTNANLYFDKGLNSLYAVVQEFEDDISSDLKVYSLSFPAITKTELSSFPEKSSNTLFPILYILLALTSAGIGYLLFRKTKAQAQTITEAPDEVEPILSPPARKVEPVQLPNSIFLFGNFMVRDRKNRDITYLFSTQLKQVFCLILQYSISEDGITSQYLSNLLWPDKPADKVKNSRGVTINNLRKTLSELDGIELVHEKGHYKIILQESAYCDYLRSLQIIEQHEMERHQQEFAQIVSRGKFLYLSDDPLFDQFKEDAETKLEPSLVLELEKSFTSESFATTIQLAEALFYIDPLSEIALVFQIKSMLKMKMSEESKLAYRTFVLEFKRVTGKEFHLSYSQLIA